MIKRVFDFTIALCGLLFVFPFLIIISIWIKIDSKGPIFYRPERGGQFGVPFRIFKFRSMVINADQIGGPTTSGNDSRVTRSGQIIRKFKLDELSQLINVVRGEMSLVGPRPEVIWKVEKFNKRERMTLKFKPGITDWASIWNSNEGGVLEGALDADAIYEKVLRPMKMELQLYYCNTRSFWGDLKIILSTIRRIIQPSWIPRELVNYPSFAELRERSLKLIKSQNMEGTGNK